MYWTQTKFDPNAFLFSTVNAFNISVRLNVTQPMQAIKVSYFNGPIFGSDLYISDSSNPNRYNYINPGYAFQMPSFLVNSSNAMNTNTAITAFSNFMSDEIEVYSTDRNLYFIIYKYLINNIKIGKIYVIPYTLKIENHKFDSYLAHLSTKNTSKNFFRKKFIFKNILIICT